MDPTLHLQISNLWAPVQCNPIIFFCPTTMRTQYLQAQHVGRLLGTTLRAMYSFSSLCKFKFGTIHHFCILQDYIYIIFYKQYILKHNVTNWIPQTNILFTFYFSRQKLRKSLSLGFLCEWYKILGKLLAIFYTKCCLWFSGNWSLLLECYSIWFLFSNKEQTWRGWCFCLCI